MPRRRCRSWSRISRRQRRTAGTFRRAEGQSMQQTGTQITKDPQEVAPYGIDWTWFLSQRVNASETIASSTWEISGPDGALEQDAAQIDAGDLTTQVELSGGTLGATYTLTN